ncbi:hypothetical protein [Halomonas sp. DQ26W]|uniref:hypothetical protein n=1 Tax=Halomonas sp. DQ26W TaxID=2282311 RepID=UPI0011C05221|nr:hypothetical protein [Halomonas sp. DQ26W]
MSSNITTPAERASKKSPPVAVATPAHPLRTYSSGADNTTTGAPQVSRYVELPELTYEPGSFVPMLRIDETQSESDGE